MKRDEFRFFGLFSTVARLVGDTTLTDLAFDVMDIVHVALRERNSFDVPVDAFCERYNYSVPGVPAWSLKTKSRGAK